MEKRILLSPVKRTGQPRLVNARLASALVKMGLYRAVDDTEPVQATELKPKAKAAPAPESEVEFTPAPALDEAVETPEPAPEEEEPETAKPTPKRRTYKRRDMKAEE